MSDEFNDPKDELKRVAEEISLLRNDIQSASAILGRIERRLRAAFTDYPGRPKQQKQQKGAEKLASSKTPQELSAIFEDLVAEIKTGGDSAFSAKINGFSKEDIIALAVEVGVDSKNRQSRKKATDAVRRRVQEAMQLQFEKKS